MYAIRARRKTVTEKDFLDAVNKVIKGYQNNDHEPLHEGQLWGKGGSQAWGSFARAVQKLLGLGFLATIANPRTKAPSPGMLRREMERGSWVQGCKRQ
ncbi:hypothetical protein GW17_00026349 [Ensete ventricosum]|nr:hypothetical protein GW17_00026349 [Ensete ventricosum]